MQGTQGLTPDPGKPQILQGLALDKDSPRGAAALTVCSHSTVLQQGTGVSVGTRQVEGQEAQEGECRGHPGLQGGWASSGGSPGEPVLITTGLSRVSGVEQRIFMQESDASNFLKRRSQRSPKSRDEVNGKDAGGLSSVHPSGSFSLPGQPGCGTSRD